MSDLLELCLVNRGIWLHLLYIFFKFKISSTVLQEWRLEDFHYPVFHLIKWFKKYFWKNKAFPVDAILAHLEVTMALSLSLGL